MKHLITGIILICMFPLFKIKQHQLFDPDETMFYSTEIDRSLVKEEIIPFTLEPVDIVNNDVAHCSHYVRRSK